MATNKERVGQLEQGFGILQDSMQRMEMNIDDKFQHLELSRMRLDSVFKGKAMKTIKIRMTFQTILFLSNCPRKVLLYYGLYWEFYTYQLRHMLSPY